MRIVFISDTHGQHSSLLLPEGDMIIHAGDFTSKGTAAQVNDFLYWFKKLPFRYKIFIGGNHDFLLEEKPDQFREMLLPDFIYLEDSMVEIEGIKIWGSPITPYFFNWAFNRQRGEDIRRYWNMIPEGIDVLVTHGPPYGILDTTARGEVVGCKDLTDRINETRPRIHVFGHIHEAYGQVQGEHTLFINASCADLKYRMVNAPVVVELGMKN